MEKDKDTALDSLLSALQAWSENRIHTRRGDLMSAQALCRSKMGICAELREAFVEWKQAEEEWRNSSK